MKIALTFLLCYLMGAVPIGLIVGKVFKGIDIRKFGSGNIGASNVLRTLGPGPAALVFIGDTAKGFLAVLLCGYASANPWVVVFGGFLSIIGHNASVFLRFKGGKGVATSLGMVIGFDWMIAVVALAFWGVLVGATRYISVASTLAAISVPTMMFYAPTLFHHAVPAEYRAVTVVAALFILVKHRSNYKRLRMRTEPRIGQKVSLEGK